MKNFEFLKVRLDKYIREINTSQSKAIALKNDLFNDYELEELDKEYLESLDDETLLLCGYYWLLKDKLDNVIESNDKLLNELYDAKRSYDKAYIKYKNSQRKPFGF